MKMASSRVEKTYSYKEVEYTFVDTVPEDLVCPVCHELLEAAQQTPCGHLFCKKCLEKTIDSQEKSCHYGYYRGGYSESLECPVCKSKHTKAACNDAYNDRRVKSMVVKCPNPPCKWTGPLSEIQKHKSSNAGCQHEKVKCPKECGEEVTRGRLPQHEESSCSLREYLCPFCSKKDTYRNIVRKHYEVCKTFPLLCPNKCRKQRIPKEEIELHLTECPEQTVKCTYQEMGCQDMVARRHLERHKQERKDHHFSLAIDRVTQLCGAVSQLYTVCEEQSRQLRQLQRQSDDSSDDGDYHPFQAQIRSKVERPVFTCQRKWLENEKVFPSMPWVIKVKNCQSAKASDSVIESKPFFTHPTGRQFCLRVHPNSSDGQHISAFIAQMAGPNDDYLEWPFKGNFKITILNQLADKEHTSVEVEKTVNRIQPPKLKESGTGRRKFISHYDLQRKESLNRQYLMDDCVYFRVALLAK